MDTITLITYPFCSLALLGEADVISGQIVCPRTPPDTIAKFAALSYIPEDEWIVPGVCAYVPQTAWLQNASIKENILFNLPYDEKRYQATIEACALAPDFKILEDGDESEIGERGVNLSGGQKARGTELINSYRRFLHADILTYQFHSPEPFTPEPRLFSSTMFYRLSMHTRPIIFTKRH